MTPGFEGFLWLKETFPNHFDFLKTVTHEIAEKEMKAPRVEGQRGRARVFLNNISNQEPPAESNTMDFPSLGGDAPSGGLTLEQRMLRMPGNKKGLAITGKKVKINFNFFLEN